VKEVNQEETGEEGADNMSGIKVRASVPARHCQQEQEHERESCSDKFTLHINLVSNLGNSGW